jgi:hypothetical protein
MGKVVFCVWKVYLRVQLLICILEAPLLNPDLEICSPDKWFSLLFSDLPGTCWRGTSTWAMTTFFFLFLYNLFFTLSYHLSMLSCGLRRYLNRKHTQTTCTLLIILTYRMQQWQFIRNFVRRVSWRSSAGADREAIHLNIRNVIQTRPLKWHCSIAGRCLGVCNVNILLLSDMCRTFRAEFLTFPASTHPHPPLPQLVSSRALPSVRIWVIL